MNDECYGVLLSVWLTHTTQIHYFKVDAEFENNEAETFNHLTWFRHLLVLCGLKLQWCCDVESDQYQIQIPHEQSLVAVCSHDHLSDSWPLSKYPPLVPLRTSSRHGTCKGNMQLHRVCFNWNCSRCKIHEQTLAQSRFWSGVWHCTAGKSLLLSHDVFFGVNCSIKHMLHIFQVMHI